MELKFNLNEEDYRFYNVYCGLNSKKGKTELLIIRLSAPVVCAFIAIMLIIKIGFTEETIFTAAFFAVPSLILVLFSKKLYMLNIRNKFNYLMNIGGSDCLGETTLIFGDEEIIDKSDGDESRQPYSAVETVYIGKRYIYILDKELAGQIVPVSSFADETQKQELTELLKAKTNAKFVFENKKTK